MTMAERPSDRAIAEAVHEQQERGYYTGACDCILTRAGEIDALRINTHAADCYLWGVKHHECALREIDRLRPLDAAPSEPPINPAEADSKLIDVAPSEPVPGGDRFVVLKASGSRYAYVNDTQERRTVKRYDILKGTGKRNGWVAAEAHAEALNAEQRAREIAREAK